MSTPHPTTVATENGSQRCNAWLFRPELEGPTGVDFVKAASTLNALPIPLTESADISAAVLYLVAASGREVSGTIHLVDAGGAL